MDTIALDESEPVPNTKMPRLLLFMSMAIAVMAVCNSGLSHADGIFKCENGGKISYQSAPCGEDKGSAVKLAPGPSADTLEAAQRGAEMEKSQAASVQAPSETHDSKPIGPVEEDCGQLASERTQAYSLRNAALGAARQGLGVRAGSSEDKYIGRLNLAITDIENNMRAKGCEIAP